MIQIYKEVFFLGQGLNLEIFYYSIKAKFGNTNLIVAFYLKISNTRMITRYVQEGCCNNVIHRHNNIAGPNDPFTHYAAIVAPTANTGTLIWNGNTIVAAFPSSTWTALPALGLSTTWFKINAGVQDVYSTIPNVQFLIIMAGYAPYASYGTIAGSRWSVINEVSFFTVLLGYSLKLKNVVY